MIVTTWDVVVELLGLAAAFLLIGVQVGRRMKCGTEDEVKLAMAEDEVKLAMAEDEVKLALMIVLLGLGTQRADPPRPDAVKFCQHMDERDAASFCQCATANDGELCKSDEPLPNFCKKMCGHAKDCHCCGQHK